MTESKKAQAANSVIWLTLQSIVGRVFSLLTNLALAWLLLEEDFGLYGVAATVFAFTNIFNSAGVNSFLFARQKHFKHWAGEVFWLTCVLSVSVSLLTIGVGVVMTSYFPIERPVQFLWLLGLMSLIPPIGALGSVAGAKMRVDFRFREISILESSLQIFGALGKISLAACGLGAFSFVLTNIVVSLIRSIAFIRLSGFKILFSVHLSRWKYFLGKMGALLLTSLLAQLVIMGDYAVVCNFVSRSTLGLFFFAYNYSAAGVILLTNGLAVVLLQVVSRERTTERQLDIFTRAAQFSTVVVFPLCLLQAALAEPLGYCLLPEKWHRSILLLQILSFGMAGRSASWLAASYLAAKGKFGYRLLLSIVSSITFLAVAVIGCLVGTWISTNWSTEYGMSVLIALAVGEAIYFPVNAFFFTWFAIRSDTTKPMVKMVEIMGKPAFSASFSVGVGYAIGRLLFPHWFAAAITIIGISLIVYWMMLLILMPEQYKNIRERVVHAVVKLKQITSHLFRGTFGQSSGI